MFRNKKIAFEVENINQLMDFFSDPVIILSIEDETILDLNKEAEDLYASEKSKMIGKSMSEFSVNKNNDYLVKIKKEGLLKDIKSVQINANNEKFDVLINAFLIEENTKKYIVSINKNVSQKNEDLITTIINHTTQDLLTTSAVIVDAQKKDMPIIYANAKFLETTGYSLEEVLGKNCKFLQKEDNKQEDLKILRAAIKNKTNCKVLLRNYKKDGTLFWNELFISPYFDIAGKLTHYIGVQNDITKEIEKQNYIEKQNEILRQANFLANVGGWEIDLKSNKQICSPELINIREDDESQNIVSKDYSLNFYPEEYKKIVNDAMKSLIENENKIDFVVPFISKKGTKKWVRNIGSSFVNSQGERKIYGVLKDITLEKNQEITLKKAAEELLQYKTALDQIAIISIIDLNENIVHANESFCKKLNCDLSKIIGKHHPYFDEIINPNYKYYFNELKEDVLNGSFSNKEILVNISENKTIWLNQFVIPINFENEKPNQLLIIDYDITKRKNQENFIQNTLEEKEVLIDEIQHRVKNNLQIVASLMNIQQGQFTDPKFKEVFNDMNNRIMSMALIHDTIFQTKNYSFIKADHYFNSIIRNLYQAISNKSIELTIEIPSEIQLGVGTATNCGIILNEALTNSIKYAFNETILHPKIYISMKRVDENPFFYEFNIKDNGVGMHAKTSESRLGLNLINGLISQMEGKMDILNQNGFHLIMSFKDNKKS